MKEQFIPIKNYEDRYLISNHGRAWSIRKQQFLSPNNNGNGYLVYHLYRNRSRKAITAHRLVALHFVEGFAPDLVINHIDKDKANNHYRNLEWVTQKQNWQHSAKDILKGNAAAKAKTYEITLPTGTTVVVCNLNEFCKNNSLDQAAMWRTINGRQSNHKGFRGKYL